MKLKSKLILTLLLLAFTHAGSVSAAVLAISSSGNGLFTLQGIGLTDVAGIDVTINYDATTLAGPQIVQGGLIYGAMMATNPNSPGVIRIAAVTTRAINGSGTLATINFSTTSKSSGKILSMNAAMLDVNGNPLGVQTQVNNPADSDLTTSNTTASGTAGSSATRYLGPAGASIPADSGDAANSKQAPENNSDQTSPPSRETEVNAQPVDAPQNPVERTQETSGKEKSNIYKSVLDSFREFTGKRTLKAFVALFEKTTMPGITQEPAVALSDGKTRVRLTIRIPSTGKKAPNFAARNAKLISLKTDGNTWIIETLPDSKTYDSSIIVLDNSTLTRIPLAVAPPMEMDIGKINIADEVRSDRKNAVAGNYMNDYALTANYLVKLNSASKRTKADKK